MTRRTLFMAVFGATLMCTTAAYAPPAIGLVAAAAGGLAAVGIGGIVGSLVGAVITAAINFVGGKLFGPKEPKAPKPTERGRMVAETQSDGPHMHVYGKARLGGVTVFRHSKSKPGSNKNELFYQLQVIAASEIDAIEEWWVNNEQVEVNGDGWVTTEPYGKFDPPEAAIEFADQPTAGDTFSLDGVTYTFVASGATGEQINIGADLETTLANIDAVLNAGSQPGRVDEADISTVYDGTGIETSEGDILTPTGRIVIAWDGQPDPEFPLAVSGANLSIADGKTVLNGDFTGYLRVSSGLGTADQAADPLLLAECPDKWTADHRLRGRAYIAFEATSNPKAFAGFDIGSAVTVVIRGRKLYDPRTGLTAYSDNAALAFADYLTADFGYRAPAEEIDWDLIAAAANICDETVATTTGTESRYRCWGIVDTSQDRREILQGLNAAMGGRYAYSGGQWRVYAGAWVEPTVDFDESDFVGAKTWAPKRSRKELFNTIRGTFVSPEHLWQPIDYPQCQDAQAVADDNGNELLETLDLAFVPSPYQCQRLAWIALRQVRQQGVFQTTLGLTGMKARATDGVRLTSRRDGLSARTMICHGWTFTTGDDGHPVIEVTLKDDAASVYAQPDLVEMPEVGDPKLPDDNKQTPRAPAAGSLAA